MENNVFMKLILKNKNINFVINKTNECTVRYTGVLCHTFVLTDNYFLDFKKQVRKLHFKNVFNNYRSNRLYSKNFSEIQTEKHVLDYLTNIRQLISELELFENTEQTKN